MLDTRVDNQLISNKPKRNNCFIKNVKPRPNDCNMPTQHIATLLGATCCVRLAIVLRCVATCRHVGCCWLKFSRYTRYTHNRLDCQPLFGNEHTLFSRSHVDHEKSAEMEPILCFHVTSLFPKTKNYESFCSSSFIRCKTL